MIRHGFFIALLLSILWGCSSGGDSAPSAGSGNTAPPPIGPGPGPTPGPSGTPNILLIIADDLGFDAFSQYPDGGTESPITPTLDMLATAGLVFDNLWVNPTCSPTRATLLTGRYGIRTGVFVPGDPIGLSELSVQSYVSDNAPTPYSNALIGKWHLSGMGNSDGPNLMGIEHYDGMLGGGVGDYTNWQRTVNGTTSTSAEYTTTALVDASIDWISQQNTPWFLWLAFNAPHTPFHLPPNSLHSRSLSGDQTDIDANPMDYYFAMIEAMDTEIGRLLNSMSAADRDNLVLFFIGDNGTPGRVTQTPPGMGRSKGSVYEGGVRTPMLAYGSGVRSGEREDALINGTDFFATVAELAGIDRPRFHDSISFVDFLSDASATGREFAYSESDDAWTIRDDQYKLLQLSNGAQELYDLQADPFEGVELISSGADVSAILQSLEDEAADIRSSDITNAIFQDTSADCADYVSSYGASVLDITRSLGFDADLVIAADPTMCTLESNNIPNHDFNDLTARFANQVAEVNRVFAITRSPVLAATPTPLAQQRWDAVMLNGVVLDLLSAGCYRPNAPNADANGNVAIGCNVNDDWLLDPLGTDGGFGVDQHNAHTQPDGTYHYHGNPGAMFDDNPGPTGSPVIGFAADGFPIYGSYLLDPNTATVRRAVSGYQLRPGNRPSSPTDPGGSYDGTYIDDYEFVGSGDLDECNGMTLNGQYGYYVTDTYPWVLGCHSGTVDPTFNKN